MRSNGDEGLEFRTYFACSDQVFLIKFSKNISDYSFDLVKALNSGKPSIPEVEMAIIDSFKCVKNSVIKQQRYCTFTFIFYNLLMREFVNLGLLLKIQRIDKDFTQRELAETMGLHTQFVSNWERGLCAPPAHSFEKLIEVLKINRGALVVAMLKDSKAVIEAKVYKKRSSKSKKA